MQVAEETPSTSYTTVPGYDAAMEVLALGCLAGGADAETRALATRMHRAIGKYAKLFPIAEPRRDVWDGVMSAISGRRRRGVAALTRAAERAGDSQLADQEAVALRWLARLLSGRRRRAIARRAAEIFTRLGRKFEAREAKEQSET